MFTYSEESALTLLTKWSNSARELLESYASFRAPEWLNQSILASWCFGGTENIEIDEKMKKAERVRSERAGHRQ